MPEEAKAEEKKIYKLSDITIAATKNEYISMIGNNQFLEVRRWATDFTGDYLVKVYKRIGDNEFEEIDVASIIKETAEYLAKNVNAKRLIKNILEEQAFPDLWELFKRTKNGGKVTVGTQKGSCMYLYIRGKKGPPKALQLTN